ncbi:MAG: alpha/beta hydrolase [Saprospiraceae bacterium]|nr:alpha/beta hydrolase [Saprospiraceae bacterium]
MNQKTAFILCSIWLSCAGCLRLDDQFFDPSKIDAYRMHAYTGEVDFRLPPSYDIATNLIQWQLIPSYATNNKATNIWSVFIGRQEGLPTDTIILYCHGNRDHLDFYWPRLQLLAHTGGKHRYGVLSIDYQGFGLSEGKPSQEALIQDVQAALDWLAERNVPPERIILYGFSLGSIPAIHHASLEPLSQSGKLILEAPLNSSATLVQDASTLSLPGAFVTDLNFNNERLIQHVDRPLLWIHGTHDEKVSLLAHGEPVFHAHKGLFKEALIVVNGIHDKLPEQIGFEAYLDSLAAFIVR